MYVWVNVRRNEYSQQNGGGVGGVQNNDTYVVAYWFYRKKLMQKWNPRVFVSTLYTNSIGFFLQCSCVLLVAERFGRVLWRHSKYINIVCLFCFVYINTRASRIYWQDYQVLDFDFSLCVGWFLTLRYSSELVCVWESENIIGTSFSTFPRLYQK